MTKKIITVLLSLLMLVPCFAVQAEPQGLGVELLGNTSFETPTPPETARRVGHRMGREPRRIGARALILSHGQPSKHIPARIP